MKKLRVSLVRQQFPVGQLVVVNCVLSASTFGGGVLARYRPVDESTMCTTIMGRVIRESSGSASVAITCTLQPRMKQSMSRQNKK